ncbi:MAG: 4-hydroxy-tetrahydrodipicolinate synthase [Flavobacteriaceae bacterium]|nr:4-hydroxy-tetrahydrodipicolinate synthase [Flavobacteriaceae bacterium]
MKEFLGTGVALVTPFTSNKKIDFTALESLVNYQIDNGIDYLVVLGTTGENSTLSKQEQQQIKDKIIEVNKGRLPLVIGIGGNNTQAVVEELENSDLSKFTAILSVSPYYNKPTQNGIYQHFKAISKASSIPVILYNVPPRTGSNMEPKTVSKLAENCKNIIAIKEASGDFEQGLELLRNKPKDFMVISGEDKLALPLTLAGGSGVISVIGQALPSKFSQMIKLGLGGKPKQAFGIFYKLMPSIDLIFTEGNPAGIKALLSKLNICGTDVRLPLVKATNELQQDIDNFINEYKTK